MTSAAARSDVDRLVLWDPVRSGKAYLKESSASHRSMLRRAHVKPEPRARGERITEALGFPLMNDLRADLDGLDLLSTRQLPADDVLFVESNKKVDQKPLRNHVESLGARVERLDAPVPQFWTWQEDFGGIVVPHRIVESVVSWMAEAPA